MTYCVGMMLDRGLVLMSDTRTNSGVDNISVFRKMFHWSIPGERIISVMTAGNLATTQAVISLLEERSKAPGERANCLLSAPTMFQVATEVGQLLRDVISGPQTVSGEVGQAQFAASLIVAGQIAGMEPRLFLIYPEGNFIEASPDTPFFQIGETKYGRPIMIRGYDPHMSFEDAVKLLLVSFDSTVKSNLSVGLPFDMEVYEDNSFSSIPQKRMAENDPVYRSISSGWGDALKEAFQHLPSYQI